VDTAGEWITALTTKTRVPGRARVESNDPFLSQAHAEIRTHSEKRVPEAEAAETPSRRCDATLTAAELSKNHKPNRRMTPEEPV